MAKVPDECVSEDGESFDFKTLTRDQAAALQVKRAALVDLGRHFGAFQDNLNVNAKPKVINAEPMSEEEWAETFGAER